MISKEVLITTTVFILILTLGMSLFDTLRSTDNYLLITGATTAENTTQGNQITGAVVGVAVEGTGEYEGEVIGEYSINPSFEVETDFDLTADYDELKEKVRSFQNAVSSCTQEGNSVEYCVAFVLPHEEYSGWLFNEICETQQQILFYDFIEAFESCSESEDNDCLCSDIIDNYKQTYPQGDNIINIKSDTFTHSLDVSSNIFFYFVDNELTYTINEMSLLKGIYDKELNGEIVDEINFILDIDNIQDAGFDVIDSSNNIYLYKDHESLFLLSTDDYSTLSTSKNICNIPEKRVYKFCIPSSDESLTQTFAIDFSYLIE